MSYIIGRKRKILGNISIINGQNISYISIIDHMSHILTICSSFINFTGILKFHFLNQITETPKRTLLHLKFITKQSLQET